MRKAFLVGGCLLLVGLAGVAIPREAPAASLGSKVVRGAAIGLAVKTAAKPLNSFINTVTLRHKKSTNLGTKVVPILSVGEKGFVGGAQVSGPQSLVDQVQAVFQYEQHIASNNYRAKVLLASSSLNPLELRRVPKVGVSAIIDVALDGTYGYDTVGTGIQTGDVIRNAGVVAAVAVAGPQINKVVNTLTFNKGLATKVVPMGSFGEKAYLGGAQVSASANTIGQVKALWQYEDLFANGKFRVKVLLPVSALNPLQAKRVEGAGLTAVVDMAVSQQQRPRSEPIRTSGSSLPNIFGGRTGTASDRRDDDDDRDRAGRHDNGRHLGWYKGKHKGWDKNKKKDKKDKHDD